MFGKSAYKYKGIACHKCHNEAPNCTCKPVNLSWKGYPLQLQELWQSAYLERKRLGKIPTKQKYFSKSIRDKSIYYIRQGYAQSSKKYREIKRIDSNGHWTDDVIKVSDDILSCMKRMYSLINYYKYLIPHRIKRQEQEKRRKARDKRILDFVNKDKRFVYGIWDQKEDKIHAKMSFEKELTTEEKRPLRKWISETFGKPVILIHVGWE